MKQAWQRTRDMLRIERALRKFTAALGWLVVLLGCITAWNHGPAMARMIWGAL